MAERELAGAACDTGAVIGELLIDGSGAEVAETGVRVAGSEGAAIAGEGGTSEGMDSSLLRWRRGLGVFFVLRLGCSSCWAG